MPADRPHQPPVHFHPVLPRPHLGTEGGNHAAVDRHVPGCNKAFAETAGTDAACRQILLQAFRCGFRHPALACLVVHRAIRTQSNRNLGNQLYLTCRAQRKF